MWLEAMADTHHTEGGISRRGTEKTVRRREFLILSVGSLAGCLSGRNDEEDPTEEFNVKSSLGANDSVGVTETVNQSLRFEGDGVITRDSKKLEYEDWERELCHDVALVELREALRSVDITSYSHIVPSFGEVSGRIIEGHQGDTDELGEYGVREGSDVLMVQHVSVIDNDGSVVRSPALGYEDLVGATPRSVTVSVVSDGVSERDVECPVIVWKTAQLSP